MVGEHRGRDDAAMRVLDDATLLRGLTVAVDGFGNRLALVRDEDWVRPTPCTEWDVRALVNHVVGANVRYVMLLNGAPLGDVEATRAVDHLGDDPTAAFEATAAEMIACFREPASFERTFRHAAGERDGRELLVMRVYDIGVHTWDLARAVGADERIDDDVVEIALTMVTAAVPAPPTGDAEAPNSSAQDKLLVRSGRQPDKEADKEVAR